MVDVGDDGDVMLTMMPMMMPMGRLHQPPHRWACGCLKDLCLSNTQRVRNVMPRCGYARCRTCNLMAPKKVTAIFELETEWLEVVASTFDFETE